MILKDMNEYESLWPHQVTGPLTWTRDCMALPRPLSAMVPWWLWLGGVGALRDFSGRPGIWMYKFIRFRKTMQSGSSGLPRLQSIGNVPDTRRNQLARVAKLRAGGVSVREKVKNNADWFITSFQEVLVPCPNSRACDGLWSFLAN